MKVVLTLHICAVFALLLAGIIFCISKDFVLGMHPVWNAVGEWEEGFAHR